MATSASSHLEAIDEKFCQCSICLQQYREPKLLPCLHRYCSDCLEQLIERNQGIADICCPECRDEVKIPTEGVDGFKTDFYMKNIIEYIQLQKSLGDEKLRDCYGCSKVLIMTSYCFKCTGFLCKGCYEYHVTSNSLKEHKQHVLTLEDLESKKMTLEKVSDLKEAPRCQSHLNDFCLVCCRTCNELPVCLTCVHGIHKNHDINDVKIIAAEKRENLQKYMTNLHKYHDQHKDRMLKFPNETERVKECISSKLKSRKKTLTARHELNIQTVKMEMKKTEKDFKHNKTVLENNKDRELGRTRDQMDEDVKQITIKYENMFIEIEKQRKLEIDNLRKLKAAKFENSREKLEILETEFQRSVDIFSKEQQEKFANLDKMSQQIVCKIRRCENLKAMSNSVLETTNDWTAVQCIPDICKAIEALAEDMERQDPDFDELTKVSFEIKESDVSPVHLEEFKTDGWIVDDITGVRSDGTVVITGRTQEKHQSYITVMNTSGYILYSKQMKGTYKWAFRFCANLSESRIATVCCFNEIGVFDTREYSYIKKNISDVIDNWPANREVSCVATDNVNELILVGTCKNNNIYVFDDQLQYQHTVTLPEMIEHPREMAFSEGKLIVCDSVKKKVYILNIEGQRGDLTHELTEPDCHRRDWDPLSVCTDSNGLAYVLWMAGDSFTAGRRVIVQYTPDGSHSLRQKEIDSKDARCIATVKTNPEIETVWVASFESAMLHIYEVF